MRPHRKHNTVNVDFTQETSQSVPQPPPSFFFFISFSCLHPSFTFSSPIPLVSPFPFLFFLAASTSPPLFGHCFSSLHSSVFPPLSSSASLHQTQSHPSSLGRHMCCFDSKGSDGVRGRKAATPWQQSALSVGKHIRPSITEDRQNPPTVWVSAIVTACLAQLSRITGEVLNQCAVLILYESTLWVWCAQWFVI